MSVLGSDDSGIQTVSELTHLDDLTITQTPVLDRIELRHPGRGANWMAVLGGETGPGYNPGGYARFIFRQLAAEQADKTVSDQVAANQQDSQSTETPPSPGETVDRRTERTETGERAEGESLPLEDGERVPDPSSPTFSGENSMPVGTPSPANPIPSEPAYPEISATSQGSFPVTLSPSDSGSQDMSSPPRVVYRQPQESPEASPESNQDVAGTSRVAVATSTETTRLQRLVERRQSVIRPPDRFTPAGQDNSAIGGTNLSDMSDAGGPANIRGTAPFGERSDRELARLSPRMSGPVDSPGSDHADRGTVSSNAGLATDDGLSAVDRDSSEQPSPDAPTDDSDPKQTSRQMQSAPESPGPPTVLEPSWNAPRQSGRQRTTVPTPTTFTYLSQSGTGAWNAGEQVASKRVPQTAKPALSGGNTQSSPPSSGASELTEETRSPTADGRTGLSGVDRMGLSTRMAVSQSDAPSAKTPFTYVSEPTDAGISQSSGVADHSRSETPFTGPSAPAGPRLHTRVRGPVRDDPTRGIGGESSSGEAVRRDTGEYSADDPGTVQADASPRQGIATVTTPLRTLGMDSATQSTDRGTVPLRVTQQGQSLAATGSAAGSIPGVDQKPAPVDSSGTEQANRGTGTPPQGFQSDDDTGGEPQMRHSTMPVLTTVDAGEGGETLISVGESDTTVPTDMPSLTVESTETTQTVSEGRATRSSSSSTSTSSTQSSSSEQRQSTASQSSEPSTAGAAQRESAPSERARQAPRREATAQSQDAPSGRTETPPTGRETATLYPDLTVKTLAPRIDVTRRDITHRDTGQGGQGSQSRGTERAGVDEIVSAGGPERSPYPSDIDRVVEKLYREIERKSRIERERRGL